MMSMTRVLGVLAAAVLLPACMVELEHRIACGDGYVDRRAGEQCDPEDPERAFESICDETEPGAVGSCDPATCQLDESTCEPCGNGRLDPGEECDPKQGDIDDIAIARMCAGSPGGSAEHMLPLDAPHPALPYASGWTSKCLPDCTYDRTSCGYCGNGRVEDDPTLVSLATQATRESLPEWCDGEAPPDLDRLAAYRDCGAGAVANVDCADDCLSFVDRAGPPCCLPQGADCPATDAVARCCHEFAEPDAPQHCSNPFWPGPGAPPPGSGGLKCN